MASEKNASPAARSTASTSQQLRYEYGRVTGKGASPGTINSVNGVSSAIGALGSTKAPAASSTMLGVVGDDGFVVRTTFAK